MTNPGDVITLALSKGRIFEETLPLLAAAGIEVLEDPEKSRKLILPTNQPDVRVVLVRATDVPTYVQYGGADLGVTGKDTLIEHGGQGLYQPLDLRIAKCRVSVAVREDFDYARAVKQGARLNVATKYTTIARDFFAAKGVHVDMIKLYGSMELAPLTGLADAIVDLVSTGSTLRANHLVEVERIMDISSHLVVNQAALKLKREPLRRIIDAFAAATERKTEIRGTDEFPLKHASKCEYRENCFLVHHLFQIGGFIPCSRSSCCSAACSSAVPRSPRTRISRWSTARAMR